MRKFIPMILGLNVVVFLLGMICSVVGLASYNAAQAQPVLAPASAALAAAPEPTAIVKAPAGSLPTPKPEPSLNSGAGRSEYYRGIFDICIASGKRTSHPLDQVVQACQELVRRAMDENWFETPSKGWKWPFPASFSSFNQNG